PTYLYTLSLHDALPIYSPLFESAFYKRGADNDGFWDVLQSFDDAVCVNPRSVGEPHPKLPNLWVYQSPPITRIARMFILYEIDRSEEHTSELQSRENLV